MNSALKICCIALAILLFAPAASAQVLFANPGPTNNGGSAGWAMFLNLTARPFPVHLTHMTTASTATPAASFSVEIFTRSGNALGGPVGSGPGSSTAGWTSLGTVPVIQGPVANGVSELFAIPDIFINGGDTVGVAIRFNGVGPRYFGTGTPPYGNYSDANLALVTGDARSAPFTPTGSWFASRELVGEIHYTVVSGTPGWSSQTSGVTTALNSVKAVSQSLVWAAGNGGVVLRTTNGGTSWTSVGGGAIGTQDLYAIDAISATTAFVTGAPSTTTYMFRTTNSGTSWDTVFVQAGGFLDAIKMYDANTGFALGDPVGGRWVIMRTSNGGTTWVRDTLAPAQVGTEGGSNNGMTTLGTTHIWFCSNSSPPKIYRSTDAGATWASSTLPGTATFTAGISFITTQYGVSGGNNGNAARSTDGGATWAAVTVGGTGAIYSNAAAGTINFWATRGNTVQKSADRGATWSEEFSDATAGGFSHISFVTTGTSANGWGVTAAGKIYAYFNPVDKHDLGVQSVARVVLTDSPPFTDNSGAPKVHPKDGVDPASLPKEVSDVDAAQASPLEVNVVPWRTGSSLLLDTVSFRAIVKNFGTFNEPGYQLGWQIDGANQTPISRGAIAAGSNDTVVFQWNQGNSGSHTLKAWTTLADDGNAANDTVTFNFLVASNFWTSIAASPNALSRSCAAYIEMGGVGYVYQFGGGAGTQLMSVAQYNTVTNTWATAGLAQMPASISSGAAVTVGDSTIYVFGGDNTAGLGKTLKYNVYTNTWTQLANMTTLVTDAAVVKYRDSLIYVVAGGDGLFSPAPTIVTTAVQVYHVNSDTYTSATSYPVAAGMMGFGIFKDTIITAGGWNGTAGINNAYKGVINRADPSQITWTPIAAYPVGAVTRMASIFVSRGNSGGILCAGGAIGGATLTAKAYLWNLCSNAWEQLDTFAVPRSNMKAAGKGDNIAWVIAGFTTVGVGTSDKVTFTTISGGCLNVGVNEPVADLPRSYNLEQNYPNPFNPRTTITYSVPVQSAVTLKIYSMLGQEVATVFQGQRGAGYFEAVWDGRNSAGVSVGSGVYFYKLDATATGSREAFTKVKRMLLLK